jgi:hypothetical protein
VSAQDKAATTEQWIAILHDTHGSTIGEIEIPGSPPYKAHVKASVVGRPDSTLVAFRMVGKLGDYGGKSGRKITYVETSTRPESGEQPARRRGRPPKNVHVPRPLTPVLSFQADKGRF